MVNVEYISWFINVVPARSGNTSDQLGILSAPSNNMWGGLAAYSARERLIGVTRKATRL
jgi:hypothetical protein